MTAQEAQEQQLDVPLMVCPECGATVITFGGKLFWMCDHTGQPTLTPAGVEALSHGN